MVVMGDFVNKGILGCTAGGGVRYWSVQAVVKVMGNNNHITETGRSGVVCSATKTLHRNRGAAPALVSFLIGGQLEPCRGVSSSH